jgi:hypothetical protein
MGKAEEHGHCGDGGSIGARVGLSRGMAVTREGRVIIGRRGTGAGTETLGGMAG